MARPRPRPYKAREPDPLTSLAHSVTNHAQGLEKALLKGDLVMAQGAAGMLVKEARDLQQRITDTRFPNTPEENPS